MFCTWNYSTYFAFIMSKNCTRTLRFCFEADWTGFFSRTGNNFAFFFLGGGLITKTTSHLICLRRAHRFGTNLTAKVLVGIVRLQMGAEAALCLKGFPAEVAKPRGVFVERGDCACRVCSRQYGGHAVGVVVIRGRIFSSRPRLVYGQVDSMNDQL